MKASQIVLLGCLTSQAVWAAPNSQDFTKIRVRIQDYAGVPQKVRAEAFGVAASTLAGAAVAPVWLDCSPSLASEMDARCKQNADAQDIILRLLAGKMAAAVGIKTACLGYAVIPRDGFGMFASVFVDKARRTAERSLARRSSVLGHAIAHEIVHLLSGRVEHASRGLMQAVWSRSDLLRAEASPMELSRKEKRAINNNLRARVDRVRGAGTD